MRSLQNIYKNGRKLFLTLMIVNSHKKTEKCEELPVFTQWTSCIAYSHFTFFLLLFTDSGGFKREIRIVFIHFYKTKFFLKQSHYFILPKFFLQMPCKKF